MELIPEKIEFIETYMFYLKNIFKIRDMVETEDLTGKPDSIKVTRNNLILNEMFCKLFKQFI